MNNQDSNKSRGYIALYRSIKDNWLWDEKPFTRSQAWIDILLTVNHTEQQVVIKNTVYTCKIGECLRSQDTWAKQWGWKRSEVRRFFRTLTDARMISLKNERKTTRLSVCNWDSYQPNPTLKRHSVGTQTTTNNNVNNEKEYSPLTKNLISVNKMEEPLTTEQGELLIDEFGLTKVNEILLAMENHKPLLSKNKSAYLTARNWLKRSSENTVSAANQECKPSYSTTDL